MASELHPTGPFCLMCFLLVCSASAAVPDKFTVSVPDDSLSVWTGSSAILPCSLSPAFTDLELRWHQPERFKTPILLYQKQVIQRESADPAYRDRVSFIGDLQNGNLSLKMDSVTLEDNGEYFCYVSAKTGYNQASIHLIVKAMGTPPVLSVNYGGSGQVNVTCESEGWSPPPTLTWRVRGGGEIPGQSHQSTTDAHGLVSVSSWVVLPSSSDSSDWLSCSVGLSDEERRESRVLPWTDTMEDLQRKLDMQEAEMKSLKQTSESSRKDVIIGILCALLVLTLSAVAIFILYERGVIKCKPSEEQGGIKRKDSEEQVPLANQEVEILTREKAELKPLCDDNILYSPGENAPVSCQLSPGMSAVAMEIRWFKGTECVCLYKDGQVKKRSDFEGRVSLCMNELKAGKIVLNLNKIDKDDAGKYVCQVIQRLPSDCEFQMKYSPYAKDKNFNLYPVSGGSSLDDEDKKKMEKSAQELGRKDA